MSFLVRSLSLARSLSLSLALSLCRARAQRKITKKYTIQTHSFSPQNLVGRQVDVFEARASTREGEPSRTIQASHFSRALQAPGPLAPAAIALSQAEADLVELQVLLLVFVYVCLLARAKGLGCSSLKHVTAHLSLSLSLSKFQPCHSRRPAVAHEWPQTSKRWDKTLSASMALCVHIFFFFLVLPASPRESVV